MELSELKLMSIWHTSLYAGDLKQMRLVRKKFAFLGH